MATPHVSGVIALMLQKDMEDGKIDLNQTRVEEILEETALKITWYKATVYDPITGGYVTYTWRNNAIGSGLIQADAAILDMNV